MQFLSFIFGVLVSSTSVQSSLAFTASSAATFATKSSTTTSALNVASVEIPAVADMERGVGGRIEASFAAAKEKGEAAFVTFVTAGYPTAAGKFCRIFLGWLTP